MSNGAGTRIRESKAKILSAAEDVFLRSGFLGANMDSVAEAAGVSMPRLRRLYQAIREGQGIDPPSNTIDYDFGDAYRVRRKLVDHLIDAGGKPKGCKGEDRCGQNASAGNHWQYTPDILGQGAPPAAPPSDIGSFWVPCCQTPEGLQSLTAAQ